MCAMASQDSDPSGVTSSETATVSLDSEDELRRSLSHDPMTVRSASVVPFIETSVHDTARGVVLLASLAVEDAHPAIETQIATVAAATATAL